MNHAQIRIFFYSIIVIGMTISSFGCYKKPMIFGGQFSSYPFTAAMQNGDYIPVVVVASNTNQNINWSTMKALMTQGINWSALPQSIQNANINWTDNALKSQGLSGVNWQSINISTGGVNWQIFANGGSVGTIWCTKSNGQPGKCATSISGITCTSCI